MIEGSPGLSGNPKIKNRKTGHAVWSVFYMRLKRPAAPQVRKRPGLTLEAANGMINNTYEVYIYKYKLPETPDIY